MLKRVLFAVCLVAGVAVAQEWVRVLDGGLGGDDDAFDVAVSPSGDVHVAGLVERAGYNSGVVVKYSPDGTRRWLLDYEPFPGFNCAAARIAASPSGCVFAACTCKDSSDVTVLAILKLSAEGSLLRETRYSFSDHIYDSPRDIKADAAGGCVVAGDSRSATTGYDFLVVRVDSTGDTTWTARYDMDGRTDHLAALALDSAGNVYVVGNGIVGWHTVAVIVRYASTGRLDWARAFDSPGETAEFEAVAVASDGVYAIGSLSGGADRVLTVKYSFDGERLWAEEHVSGDAKAACVLDTLGVFHCSSAHDSLTQGDIKTMRYTKEGYRQWVRRYDGPGNAVDAPEDMAVDPTRKKLYITGLDQGIETFWDCLTLCYDSDGTLNWAARYPGEGMRASDEGRAVDIDSTGNVVVVGYTTRAETGVDILTIKYPPSGPGVEDGKSHSRFAGRFLQVLPSVAARGCRLQVPDGSGCGGLRVVDVTGRAVRSFGPVAGGGDVLWDLRDDAGAAVANGVYLVVADGPDSPAPARIIVQR